MSSNFSPYADLSNVGEKIKNIGLKLIENENLCKLIKFTETDCLSKDITDDDRYSLIIDSEENQANRRIFFMPFTTDTVDDRRVELRIYPNFNIENRTLVKCFYCIEIIVNNNLYSLDDTKIRPIEILSEIMKSLNGADIGSIGLLSCVTQNFMMTAYNNYFSGYRLAFMSRKT